MQVRKNNTPAITEVLEGRCVAAIRKYDVYTFFPPNQTERHGEVGW